MQGLQSGKHEDREGNEGHEGREPPVDLISRLRRLWRARPAKPGRQIDGRFSFMCIIAFMSFMAESVKFICSYRLKFTENVGLLATVSSGEKSCAA